jgi:hypothetical protein
VTAFLAGWHKLVSGALPIVEGDTARRNSTDGEDCRQVTGAGETRRGCIGDHESLRQLQRVIWNVSHLIVLASGLQQKSNLNEKWQVSRFQEIDEEAAL